jgi:hypothetical protein
MEIAASPRINHKSVPSQACSGNLADLLFISSALLPVTV